MKLLNPMDADIKGVVHNGKEIEVLAGKESCELSLDACKFVKSIFTTVKIIEGGEEVSDTELKKKAASKAKRIAALKKARAAKKSKK